MMTKDKLRSAIGDAYGAWYWRKRGLFNFKPGKEGQRERVFCIRVYRALRAELAAGRYTAGCNARGNIVWRDQDADARLGVDPRGRAALTTRQADRYLFDCGPCNAWQQFDTWQDASYFGVWFDDATRRVFTYCEGDRTLVECPTAESYAAEIADMIAFYQRSAA